MIINRFVLKDLKREKERKREKIGETAKVEVISDFKFQITDL